MAKQNLFILTALLALTALVGCEEKDWSRGEYLLAGKDVSQLLWHSKREDLQGQGA